MTKIKNENYFVVHGWMRNILKLRNRELDVFAIIYGFSQTEGNYFTGSLEYLQEWCGLSKPAIINILNNLLEKNYFNQLLVNSSHRQCVDKIGKNLTPTLFSDDIICEGITSKNNKILAVQFHPERLKTNPECIYKYFISLK